jgi:peptidoglycan L-alanyl-D-glutamate endopeptidase CwlK
MPQYSAKSKEKLSMAHPDLQILFNKVIKYFDNTILCSVRTEREQNLAFEEGRSKKKYPDSLHNSFPSLAVDVQPYPFTGTEKQKRDKLISLGFYVKGMAKILKEMDVLLYDIRWGGDWNNNNDITDERWEDLFHFEIISTK